MKAARRSRELRLHAGPEPGRPQIKPVVRHQAGLIYGEDTPAQVISPLEQLEIDSHGSEQLSAVQDGQTTSDNCNCCLSRAFIMQDRNFRILYYLTVSGDVPHFVTRNSNSGRVVSGVTLIGLLSNTPVAIDFQIVRSGGDSKKNRRAN